MWQEKDGYIIVVNCIALVLSYVSAIIDPGGWQL